jgi:predicted homoserine dehydrogenase-like protein
VAAADKRITVGVVGIGPRCTYDLTSMLAQPDMSCVAIADVQVSRRQADKALFDQKSLAAKENGERE